jgi:hypothetical protein
LTVSLILQPDGCPEYCTLVRPVGLGSAIWFVENVNANNGC